MTSQMLSIIGSSTPDSTCLVRSTTASLKGVGIPASLPFWIT